LQREVDQLAAPRDGCLADERDLRVEVEIRHRLARGDAIFASEPQQLARPQSNRSRFDRSVAVGQVGARSRGRPSPPAELACALRAAASE
jgi:hypothetical protein